MSFTIGGGVNLEKCYTNLLSADTNNNGPLILVLLRPIMFGSSVIEYTLTQSASQGAVVSIEQFLDMSWVSCSILIDSVDASSYTDFG